MYTTKTNVYKKYRGKKYLLNVMQFMLCGNFLNLETLFKCLGTKSSDASSSHRFDNSFSLVIDKRISTYPYALKLDHTRVSLVDMKTRFLNTPNKNTILPHIFTHKRTKGMFMHEAIHPDVAPFYKNLILSTLEEQSIIKLHIVLNDIHVLLTTYPILDNKKKIIGCTLLEIPYLDVADMSEMKGSMLSVRNSSTSSHN